MRYFIILTLVINFSGIFSQNREGTIEVQQSHEVHHSFDLFGSKDLYLDKEAVVNTKAFSSLFIQNPKHVFIPITIEGKVKNVKFEEANIFSPDFKIATSSGKDIPLEKIHCYRGKIEGDDHSFASLVFGKEYFSMLIADKEMGNVEINRAANKKYFVKKGKMNAAIQCSAHDDHDHHDEEIRKENSSARGAANCIDLYVEVDNAAFIANGSNTQAWATNIFNQVNILYNNYNVPLIISQIFIWNTADPFASSTNINAMRSSFLTRLVTLGISGKIGYLLSTRPIGGGISNGIGGFCNAMNQYPGPMALSTSLATSVTAYPTYSYSVQNVAHELGHVMGLRHSHACVWNGNNTQVDDCGNVYAANNNGTPEGSCYNPASPILPGVSGGTIMSNCDLLSGQSINFAVGFGPIIGNQLFLNFVNAPCNTASSCGTIPPPNDDCLDAIPLTLTNTCSVRTFDNKNGTQSANTPLFSCLTQASYTDVWFTAIIPTSGSMTIETKQVIPGFADMVIQAYSGTCNALTQISCDDNSGDADHARIILTGRTPGEKIYFRIVPKDKPGADDFDDFGLCAYDASLPCHPDFNSLVAFYNATGGPSWTNKTGWSSSATNCNVCTWQGVVCDASGRVTALNLGFNNLTGSIPSSLTGLSRLSKINMYDNNFAAGPLPTFLNQFPLLEYVDLGSNAYNGTIPTSYGSIPNLRTLYLDNNTLTGTLPSTLVNTALITMWLNNNNLSGCIPNNYTQFCLRNTTIKLSQNPLLPGAGDYDAFCDNNQGGDFDNDGICGGPDCDDNNAATFPGAPEICDGKDNDCDNSIDESIPDVTNTWIGTTNGNWNVATNWSSGFVPEKCHNVVISPASAITVTIPNGYTAKASSITIGANGRILSQFNSILNVVDKGEISNSGIINMFGRININNPLNTSGIALTNSGTITVNSTGNLSMLNLGATAIRNNAGASISNNGTINVTNNHATNGLFGVDNRGSITNTGLLSVSNINGREIRLATGAVLLNNSQGAIEAK